MNYIAEIKAFNDWLLTNPMSTGAIALWYQIMAINNKAAWAEDFVVANTVLQSMTGLSRSGLDRARNVLIQKKLIEYKKGTSNKAGRYKIISFFECQKEGTERAQDGSQGGSQGGHSSSTLNKLNKTKKDEDEKYNTPENIFVKIFQETAKGKNVSERLIQETSNLLVSHKLEFSRDLLIDALDRALDRYLSGQTGPFPEYFVGVLKKEQERRDMANLSAGIDSEEYPRFERYNWLNGAQS